MTLGDLGEGVAEVGFGIYFIQFCRLHDRVHRRCSIATAVGAGKEIVLPLEGDAATSAGPKGRHAPPALAIPRSPSSARRPAALPRPAPRSPRHPRVRAVPRRCPSMPTRAPSRQRSSRYTGTPSSRDRLSAASPRSRRRTTSRLRPTLQRWPGARPPAGTDCPGESVDGLRPTSLPTGPTAAPSDPCKISVIRLVLPRFLRTIVCPKKPGPAHWLARQDLA